MIRKNAAFLVPTLLWFIVGAVILFLFSKPGIHIYLNQFHSPAGDVAFRYITMLGDGIFAVIIMIVLLMYNFRMAFQAGVALVFSTLVTQFMKRIIYFDVPRPAKFFEQFQDITIRFVPEVHLYSYNSFPSGHASTAFCLFLCLAIFTPHHLLKLAWFIVAMFVAYSRVYLSQHFFVDIYFGSMLAVLITLITFHFFNDQMLSRYPWARRSLISRKGE